jgi:hypothetical protein
MPVEHGGYFLFYQLRTVRRHIIAAGGDAAMRDKISD